jgi:hypothetical protein
MGISKKGVLITFTVQGSRFRSVSERNKFFKELYGWKQIITKEKRAYVYRREGILDTIPHMKVDQSSFIVDEDDFDKIFEFFEEWKEKVLWRTFKVLLDEKTKKLLEEFEEEEDTSG